MNSDLGHGIDLLGATVSLAALAEKICPAGAVTTTAATAELAAPFLECTPFDAVGHELAGQYRFVRVLGVNLSAPSILPVAHPTIFSSAGSRSSKPYFAPSMTHHTAEGSSHLSATPGSAKAGCRSRSHAAPRHGGGPVHQLRGLSLVQATPYAPIPPSSAAFSARRAARRRGGSGVAADLELADPRLTASSNC